MGNYPAEYVAFTLEAGNDIGFDFRHILLFNILVLTGPCKPRQATIQTIDIDTDYLWQTYLSLSQTNLRETNRCHCMCICMC